MLVAFYIAGLFAAVFLVVGCVLASGKSPGAAQIGIGLALGLVSTCLLSVLIVIMSVEGNGHRLPLVMLLGAAPLFACVRPPRRAAWLSTGLFVGLCVLSQLHFRLAHSGGYTDNPAARLSVIRYHRTRGTVGTDLPKVPIRVFPTWHTCLTGLYVVSPPAGGMNGE